MPEQSPRAVGGVIRNGGYAYFYDESLEPIGAYTSDMSLPTVPTVITAVRTDRQGDVLLHFDPSACRVF